MSLMFAPISTALSTLVRIALVVCLPAGLGACVTESGDFKNAQAQRFQGSPDAVVAAERMFRAIGGKKRWSEIRSVYVKARHTEPQLEQPYVSEIWRALDAVELRIEQRSEAFHRLARVDSEGGQVAYLDEGDRVRTLTLEQHAQWIFDHNHNVYVLLHRLGKTPAQFKVVLEDTDRLTFYEGEERLAGFRLDAQDRPHLFYQPASNGELITSRFSKWGTHNGLVHSAGGGPVDGGFEYVTLEWQASDRAFNDAYSFPQDTR